MPEETTATRPYKSPDEEQKEYRESYFTGEIRQSFESAIKSLKRLGVVSEYKGTKESPYTTYGATGKSPVDLNDLPSPFNINRSLSKPTEVTIGFGGPDAANNYLHITWKSPQHEEHLMMHGNRPYSGPFLSWMLHSQGSKGEKITQYKNFDGKFGNGKDQFSEDNFLSGGVSIKEFAEALDKKAKVVPHPNPVARLFGK